MEIWSSVDSLQPGTAHQDVSTVAEVRDRSGSCVPGQPFMYDFGGEGAISRREDASHRHKIFLGEGTSGEGRGIGRALGDRTHLRQRAD